MQRRKAETLIEFLVAVFIFGILMTSLFNFMAVQTENAVIIKINDNLFYKAQWLLNHDYEEIEKRKRDFESVISYDIEGKKIKVYRNGTTKDNPLILQFKN